ncbi:hypothetical protein IKE98_01690 [Candidatus Saccharibacteria bacterium]|nr:hypothetical protein [Candidatus Saccharibacteria bacterium]
MNNTKVKVLIVVTVALYFLMMGGVIFVSLKHDGNIERRFDPKIINMFQSKEFGSIADCLELPESTLNTMREGYLPFSSAPGLVFSKDCEAPSTISRIQRLEILDQFKKNSIR